MPPITDNYAFLTQAQKDAFNAKATNPLQTPSQVLPITTPPNSAAAVNQLPAPQLPTNVPQTNPTGVANAAAATTGAKTQIDEYQKYLQDQMALDKEKANAIQDEQQNAKESILNIFNTRPTQKQTRADAFNQIGLNPADYFADQKAKIAEIDSLNQDYNKFKADVEQQKANVYGQGKGAPIDLLNNQIAQIERNAAPQLNRMSANINSHAATLQALQGNFAKAQQFVDDAVGDATADTKFAVDTIKTFYDMNQDAISRLDSKYDKALTQSINLAEKTYEEDKAVKKFAADNMIKYPNAGISLNDNQGTVAQKVAAVGGDTTSSVIGSAETGYSNVIKDTQGNVIKVVPITGGGNPPTPTPVKLTSTQTNKGAQRAGLAVEAFKGLDDDVKNYYVNVSNDGLAAMQQAVKDGDTELIDGSNLAPSVKEYFKSQIKTKEAVAAKPNLLSNIWNSITGFLNNSLAGANKLLGK